MCRRRGSGRADRLRCPPPSEGLTAGVPFRLAGSCATPCPSRREGQASPEGAGHASRVARSRIRRFFGGSVSSAQKLDGWLEAPIDEVRSSSCGSLPCANPLSMAAATWWRGRGPRTPRDRCPTGVTARLGVPPPLTGLPLRARKSPGNGAKTGQRSDGPFLGWSRRAVRRSPPLPSDRARSARWPAQSSGWRRDRMLRAPACCGRANRRRRRRGFCCRARLSPALRAAPAAQRAFACGRSPATRCARVSSVSTQRHCAVRHAPRC